MDALNELPARRDLPGELRQGLVLLVRPRESRIAARLTVVVAKNLVARKNHSRSARMGLPRLVVKSPYLARGIAALTPVGVGNWKLDRLTGESGGLPVVRRVIQEALPSLPRDDVDDGALNVPWTPPMHRRTGPVFPG